jgi:hypothetical protein
MASNTPKAAPTADPTTTLLTRLTRSANPSVRAWARALLRNSEPPQALPEREAKTTQPTRRNA